MKEQKSDWRLLVGIILIAVLAFVGVFLGVSYPRPVEVPGEVVVLPAATPADEIVALGYESHFTGMFVEMWMGGEEQDAMAVTAGLVVTPTGTYQPLTSAGNVTCTLGTMGAWGRYTGVRNVTYTTGSLLWLVNESSTFITVTETSHAGGTTSRLTGTTVALGQYDTLTLFFDGNDWVELSESNN